MPRQTIEQEQAQTEIPILEKEWKRGTSRNKFPTGVMVVKPTSAVGEPQELGRHVPALQTREEHWLGTNWIAQ